jgi:hypothetical protein
MLSHRRVARLCFVATAHGPRRKIAAQCYAVPFRAAEGKKNESVWKCFEKRLILTDGAFVLYESF